MTNNLVYLSLVAKSVYVLVLLTLPLNLHNTSLQHYYHSYNYNYYTRACKGVYNEVYILCMYVHKHDKMTVETHLALRFPVLY